MHIKRDGDLDFLVTDDVIMNIAEISSIEGLKRGLIFNQVVVTMKSMKANGENNSVAKCFTFYGTEADDLRKLLKATF